MDLPKGLPWDHPDADPMGDVRAALDYIATRYAKTPPLPASARLADDAAMGRLREAVVTATHSPSEHIMGGQIGSLLGIPVIIDADVPQGVLRLAYPDGTTTDVTL